MDEGQPMLPEERQSVQCGPGRSGTGGTAYSAGLSRAPHGDVVITALVFYEMHLQSPNLIVEVAFGRDLGNSSQDPICFRSVS